MSIADEQLGERERAHLSKPSLEDPTQPTTEESYHGLTWAQRTAYGHLRAVLDVGDTSGRKNAYIDHLHKVALAEALGHRRFRRALDFGCGSGRFLDFLSKRSDEVTAFDRTPEMLALAKSTRALPEENFICGQEATLPFADGVFDLILSVYVISCAPRENFGTLIGELGRVCEPGGVIALVEQIDNGRGLTPRTYLDVFHHAGFEVTIGRPIRTASSTLMRWSLHPWLPSIAGQMLGRIEIDRMAAARFAPTTIGYWDYLIVAKRVTAAFP